MISLFEKYPLLAEKLSYIPIGDFPTPVQKLERLGKVLGVDQLYIKRDDLSGRLYGGNKLRKLEFILGDALRSEAKTVITFGAAGSNHALATAIYTRQLGLKSILMLVPQPIARYVRSNLLMSYYCGAELHSYGAQLKFARTAPLVHLATIYKLMRCGLKDGSFPRFIPPGGSSPIGIVGYVNAALELKEQIVNGEILEPDCIYVACGTMGTTAGLVLGLKAANICSRIVPVRVTGEEFVNTTGMIKMISKGNSLIHSMDNSFPMFEFSAVDTDIRHDYFGKRYALFTKEGMKAVMMIRDYEGIKLEGTYTGKTLAALINDARVGRLRNKTVLFWNTLNSRDFSEAISHVDYHDLPRCFHKYFEEVVQPLDFD